jgi:O-Antigen ligase.
MIIILFLPFQQAFTLQVGATVRIADIFICILFALMLLKNVGQGVKVVYINSFYIYLLLNTIIMSFLLRGLINDGLNTLLSVNSRNVTNILTALVAIMAYSVGVYIGKYNKIFEKIIKLWTKLILFLSVYTIIQFLFLNIIGYWPHLPGEVVNVGATLAFNLKRAYGFSIEPGAVGTLLVFSFILIYNFLNSCLLKKISLLFCIIAIFCSVSTVAIVSIVVFILLSILFDSSIKIRYKILILALLVLMIFLIFNIDNLHSAIIDKLLGTGQSKMDRLSNGVILKRMFLKYPISGIGFGNYGALRNLFSDGTLTPYKSFYDATNSFYFGILGELGLIGVLLFAKFAIDKMRQVKFVNKKIILTILPFLLLISPSSTITPDYMAIGLGMIYGRYLEYKFKNNITSKHKRLKITWK